VLSNLLVAVSGLIFVFPSYVSPRGTFATVMVPIFEEEFALAASFRAGGNSGRHLLHRLAHSDRHGSFVMARWLTEYHMLMLCIAAGSP
jgi:hypothetical protein